MRFSVPGTSCRGLPANAIPRASTRSDPQGRTKGIPLRTSARDGAVEINPPGLFISGHCPADVIDASGPTRDDAPVSRAPVPCHGFGAIRQPTSPVVNAVLTPADDEPVPNRLTHGSNNDAAKASVSALRPAQPAHRPHPQRITAPGPTLLTASPGPRRRHWTTVRFRTWRCPTCLEAALEPKCSLPPSNRG